MEREKIVKRLIIQRFNWVVGGYENAITDGQLKKMPSAEDLKSEIYDEVMSSKRLIVSGGFILVTKDIRFLGKKRIKEIVDEVYEDRIGGFENE